MGRASRQRRALRASERQRAQRTTPVKASFVEVDDTRTFLVFGAFTESMITLTIGEAPRAGVRADLTGKWNHGSEDKPVLVMSPETARSWGRHLLEVADAADRDLITYNSGVDPATGKPR